jgi:hypothetical protein
VHGVFPADGVLQLCGDGGRGGVNTKNGTGERLICGSSLVNKYHSAGKNLLKRIDKGHLRSAMRHRSAKGLFALLKERFSGMYGDVARCKERTS